MKHSPQDLIERNEKEWREMGAILPKIRDGKALDDDLFWGLDDGLIIDLPLRDIQQMPARR